MSVAESSRAGALIFDLDGLLVDSEPLAAAAMNRFLDSVGRTRDPVIQRQLLGRRLVEAMAITKDGYGLEQPLEELTELYGQMRLDALRGAVKPLPGAPEIIAWGRKQGLPIGLATSGMRQHADLSLAETGLAGLFDIEVTGDEVDRGKPAPDLFLLAAERLGIDPTLAMVLEDSPLGVEAAAAAGMQVIAVVRDGNSPVFAIEPTVRVASLHDARHWLAERLDDENQT